MSTRNELTAFNHLFSYKERFIRFAQTYVRDPDIAEDYVIDALLYYWENRNRLENESNIPAYVLTIIKHKCLNYLEHKKLQEEVKDKLIAHAQWELSTRISTLEACEPYEIFTSEAEQLVERALAKLPERTRQIFLMNRMQNISQKEIAQHMNMSVKGVEFHISKALKELRIELKDYLPLFLFYFMH
ncbi:MAG: RNA polymerase sigma-70 factor [Bacteroides sp.]|nr:RNA polymerase sigma-70 factor [Bacteroides sp.]